MRAPGVWVGGAMMHCRLLRHQMRSVLIREVGIPRRRQLGADLGGGRVTKKKTGGRKEVKREKEKRRALDDTLRYDQNVRQVGHGVQELEYRIVVLVRI